MELTLTLCTCGTSCCCCRLVPGARQEPSALNLVGVSSTLGMCEDADWAHGGLLVGRDWSVDSVSAADEEDEEDEEEEADDDATDTRLAASVGDAA